MIVFPLIRSVGLKAATASSRAATLPMFVRSRPSRTRWTASLNWARSGTNSNASVVPGKSDLVDRLGVDPLSAILPGPGGHRTVHVCFGGVPFASGPSARDPRPAAPTWCAAAVRETTHVDRCGSISLGAAVPVLEGLAVRPCRRQTRDCDRLAPQGVSVVVDVEGSSWSTRASSGVQTDSTTDSENEPREPALGSTAHPRRTPQTRHRHRRNQRWRIYGARQQATVADLADVPGESHQEYGIGRVPFFMYSSPRMTAPAMARPSGETSNALNTRRASACWSDGAR